tara:strand:+ start:834 stop:1205 length:372 start_codon:yes stop_codon:yes gene_type:complete
MEETKMKWDDWYAKYQPVMINATMDDGVLLELDTVAEVMAYFMDNLSYIDEDDISKHVWTITSGDGWSYTSTGFHFVDRESYLICLVAWEKENEACMYHDNGTWCDHCDEYTKECEHGNDKKI